MLTSRALYLHVLEQSDFSNGTVVIFSHIHTSSAVNTDDLGYVSVFPDTLM